jgi:hypothetical protein
MTTVGETAQRHADDVVAGNMAGVVGDFTPDAMAEFQKHGAMPPRPTRTAEILTNRKDGEQELFEIKYSNETESLTIRSWWEQCDGGWKIVKAEPVREQS